jgi:phage terminase small subunit
MRSAPGQLTPKQERFVQEYLVDLNATQAAIRAGYSKKTAKSIGQENLTKPDIAMAVKEASKTLTEKVGLKAEHVIEEMRRIGFANMRDYMDLSDPEQPKIDLTKLTKEQASVIAEVTYEKRGVEKRLKLKLHDKLNALVNLGKHLGLFSERHLLGGLDGGEIKQKQFVEIVFVKPEQRGNADE